MQHVAIFFRRSLRAWLKAVVQIASLLACMTMPAQATPIWKLVDLGGGDVIALKGLNDLNQVLFSCGQCATPTGPQSFMLEFDGSTFGSRNHFDTFGDPRWGNQSEVNFINIFGEALGVSQGAIASPPGWLATYWLNGVAYDNTSGTYAPAPIGWHGSGGPGTSFTWADYGGASYLDLIDVSDIDPANSLLGAMGAASGWSGTRNANDFYVFEFGFNMPTYALVPINRASVAEPGAVSLLALGLVLMVVIRQGQGPARSAL